MSKEESSLWCTEFNDCLDWNQKALENRDKVGRGQLWDNCLESDLASALLGVEKIPDTPIRGATGFLTKLEEFFPHRWERRGCYNQDIPECGRRRE